MPQQHAMINAITDMGRSNETFVVPDDKTVVKKKGSSLTH